MTADWTQETRSLSHTTRTGRRISIEGHKAIYEAVAQRDADAASAAMKKHLLDVRNIISSGHTA